MINASPINSKPLTPSKGVTSLPNSKTTLNPSNTNTQSVGKGLVNSSPVSNSMNYKRIDNYYFCPVNPLGKGAFSQVFKAYDEHKNNKEVAVKVIPASKLLQNEEMYHLFLREIDILRQIKGENIVQLLDVKRTPNNLYIFMEYCDGGDLDKYLRVKGPLSEETTLVFLKQIVNAFLTINQLSITNSKGNKVTIMHRDIKPANIIFHKGKIKIADFGFAKFVDENLKDTKLQHTILGTPLYMTPQILADDLYTTKCDVWSTGVVIYQCLFKKLPWTACNIKEMLHNIKKIPLDFPKSVSKETQDLISKMLKINEEDRLDWQSIAEHPALKNVKI